MLCLLLGGCTSPIVGFDSTTKASPAGFPCPPLQRPAAAAPRPDVTSGRVRVGAVSYPIAPAPFSAPSNVEYMAFGNLIGSQHASVEAATATSMGWDAVIALARLNSVDGAWGGQTAAEMVGQCSLSMTWRGIDYQPEVRRDEKFTIDGHPGWIRITDLRFTVPGIRATTEVQTVIVLQAGDDSYAYLSYLPDTAAPLKPTLDASRDGLRVDR
ncbi:MAG: hypothetical protein QM695_03525 [Micropruina sp.]